MCMVEARRGNEYVWNLVYYIVHYALFIIDSLFTLLPSVLTLNFVFIIIIIIINTFIS